MKSQRVPEHKMNVTSTVGQSLENMASKESPKADAQRMEVSSTGYGYESVSNESDEESTINKNNDRNPSCGGL